MSSGVGGVLEHGTVSVRTGGDDTHVVGVLDGGDDSGSENNLLPGHSNVDDVDS